MDKDIFINSFNDVANCLTPNIKNCLLNLSDSIKSAAEEIRLRAGRPLAVTVCGTQFFVLKNGTSMLPRGDMITVTGEDIEKIFLNICNNSVYSHIEELKEGYITLAGGHRAGICGTVVLKDKKITSVKDISSINLRIAKEVNFCSDGIINSFDGGILVCGAPGSGKTTLIRDMVRRLSGGDFGKCYKVSVVDSRGEIGGVIKGIPSADLGSTADIITACPKGKGIEIALRTLCPDVIVFDELGSMEEVKAIYESMNSGVSIITSAHIGSLSDLYKREQTRTLLRSGAVKKVIFCNKEKGYNYKVFDVTKLPKELCEA